MKDIIAENKAYIRSIIRKLTGSNNEDLEQEVYVKTWQHLPRYAEQGKFRQWLGKLTANLCRDYFRSKIYHTCQRENGDDVLEEISSTELTPEQILNRKNRQKIILNAVDNLPKTAREVIILFEFEDYTLEQIAHKLKIPVGTVKSRLSNARKILKQNLNFLKGENNE